MPPKQEPSHDLHIHVFPENVSGQEDSIAKDFWVEEMYEIILS